MLIPRIRGRAIQNENKSWGYEIFITIGEDSEENEPIYMRSTLEYISKEIAIEELKSQIPDLSKTICKAMKLPNPTGYIDLKKNEHVDFK